MSINTFKLLLFIIITVILIILLKGIKNPLVQVISILVSVFIILLVLKELTPAINLIVKLSEKAEINDSYLKIILKCVSICILGDFTINLCKDAGENTLAFNSEFVCKVSIIVISLPMYVDIFNLILKLWGN